jgi:hypothetical protein
VLHRPSLAFLSLSALALAQGVGPDLVITETPGRRPAAAQQRAPYTVTGRAVTWDGQPIAGVRVAIATDALTTLELLQREQPVTAADGTFALPCEPRSDDEREPRRVLLAVKGFAARALPLPGEPPTSAERRGRSVGDVVLVPAQRLFGRVRAADGKPVANARIGTRDALALLDGQQHGIAQCTARSDASGIFDLPCALPQGSTLEVEADGWYSVTLRPIAAGAPLEVELQPSGFVDGRVLAGDEGLGGARVSVRYETSADLQHVVADASGTFRVPLRHPGRYRVYARKADGGKARSGAAKLGEGPAVDVRIATEGDANDDRPQRVLRVRATTKGTGAGIAAFRAVAQWGEHVEQPWMLQQLRSRLAGDGKATADGTLEVDGPDDDGQPGAVYVAAAGHAPLLQRGVTWSEDQQTLTVELEPEASVRGIVRDEATQQPLAGATVVARPLANPWQGGWHEDGGAGVESGADGTFRVGELGPGEWELVASAPGRPPSPPLLVTLAAAQARGDVALAVPPGARVAGKLVGAPIGNGWRVSLQPLGHAPQAFAFSDMRVAMLDDMTMSFPAGDGFLGPHHVAVGADGAFAFEGLALDHYTMMLVLPRPPRSGGPLLLPIESFRLRAGGLQRDVDISNDRVWTVRGKITLPGAATPFENLVVFVLPYGMPGGMVQNGGGTARAFVGRDGAFELAAIDGRYQIAVFDLALGAVVAKSERVEVRGGDATCDVAVPLVKTTIELKPADPASVAVVERVEVRCKLAADGDGPDDFGMPDEYDFGRGVLVPRGATSLVLALPPGDTTLLLRSHAALLGDGHQHGGSPPLAKVDVPVPGDGKGTAVIEVPPPPELPVDPPEREK